MRKDILDSGKIISTIAKLCLRIEDRFPESGLLGVARELHEVAREADQTARWIEKPNMTFRLLGIAFIVAILAVLFIAISALDFKQTQFGISDFVSLSEAAINELILIGAAVVFITTYEVRRKRQRVISSLNKLRSIAHVIDAHQLTKDPDATSKNSVTTKNSPARTLTLYELGRYLDYCSELLSLTSKVAYLYVQNFDDPVSVNAVNDLESLTTGLSRKIWQKIMLLRSIETTNGAVL